jgi:hypothetical protein
VAVTLVAFGWCDVKSWEADEHSKQSVATIKEVGERQLKSLDLLRAASR